MANKIQADNLTRRGAGRPKGSPNKTTRAAKDAIAFAAEELGGGERLAAWAKEAPENEKAFWTNIYPKLLPMQVTGEDGGPVRTVTRIELVAPQGHDQRST
ncbi:hypothetical protein [Microcystis phage Mae-JY35]